MNYISAAMTVVAGLAWNDAVKSTLNKYVDAVGDDILGKYIYAVLITLITIIAVYLINELNNKVKLVLPDRASKILGVTDSGGMIDKIGDAKNHVRGYIANGSVPSQPSGVLDIGDNTKILFVQNKSA